MIFSPHFFFVLFSYCYYIDLFQYNKDSSTIPRALSQRMRLNLEHRFTKKRIKVPVWASSNIHRVMRSWWLQCCRLRVSIVPVPLHSLSPIDSIRKDDEFRKQYKKWFEILFQYLPDWVTWATLISSIRRSRSDSIKSLSATISFRSKSSNAAVSI